MNPYEMFETDKKAETEGITLDYDVFKIQIARSGGSNHKYQKVLEALTKPHRRVIDTGTITRKQLNNILVEAYSKAVVLGWEGVKDRSGKEMVFNYENCKKLFTDLPDLFEDVKDQASKVSLFKKTVLDDIAGN